MKYFLSLCTIIFLCPFARAQEKNAELSIQFISDQTVAEVNFNEEAFLNYAKLVVDKINELFEKETQQADVFIMQTFHPNASPSFEISARPALSKEREQKIRKELTSIKGIKSTLVDYTLAYLVAVKEGFGESDKPFVPEIVLPDERAHAELVKADLKTTYELIRTWAAKEAIPVLAAFASKVDEQFAGVRAVGKILSKNDFSKNVDVVTLTEKNSDYWRAVLEMSPGNQLIPVSKMLMHIAKGEFSYAQSYLEMVSLISDEKTVPDRYMKEMKLRLQVFEKKFQDELGKGLLLHDTGKYADAIAVYEKLLKVYPYSPQAKYELYFSKNALEIETNKIDMNHRADWDAAKPLIYACNPMYSTDVRASNAREGYLLYRRNEINTLFKKDGELAEDMVKYADIALDLEVYPYAAQMYWLILSGIKKETYGDRNMMAHFLYCLDKMGHKALLDNFKDEIRAEFKNIAAEREKIMKEHTSYQVMEKK
ncbi:MAG TPA: hypothetical protein VK177_00565 [Flavobacteriales bacterium]|nr:hypothetical protein [Flavobacteriales bacterium]